MNDRWGRAHFGGVHDAVNRRKQCILENTIEVQKWSVFAMKTNSTVYSRHRRGIFFDVVIQQKIEHRRNIEAWRIASVESLDCGVFDGPFHPRFFAGDPFSCCFSTSDLQSPW